MLFNLFKKKVEPIKLQQIIVKRKSNSNLYIGQIVSIDVEEGSGGDRYYLCKYPDEYVSNKITKEYEEYCEKYKYVIIKSFNDEKIDGRIICCDGYLQRYKINLTEKFNNGSAFVIKNDELYDNGKLVGKIIDNRYDLNANIIFNELDDDKLVVFIRK